MTCYPDTITWPESSDAEVLELRDIAEEFAWVTLATLTADRLSLCPIEVRPARASCSRSTYYIAPVGGATGPFHPYIGEDGRWRNAVHDGGCRCNDIRQIELPGGTTRILSVEIDGVALPTNAYRLDNGVLVRQDGLGWPLRQDMYAAAGEPGTFVVRYYRGVAPDRLAAYAAKILAEEFVAMGKPSGRGNACRLPKSVTAVTRQGTTYEMARAAFLPGEVTGISEVDIYVARLNPHGLKTQTRIMSIDTMPGISGSRPRGLAPVAGGSLVADPENPSYFVMQEA